MRPIPFLLLGLGFGLIPAPAARGEGLPSHMLADLKAATVFVHIGAGRESQSGSGFLILVKGDTGYVVTNHHVITVESPMMGSHVFGSPGRLRVVPASKRTLATATVVFQSGTKNERSVRGEVVADDQAADLAVIKVGPVANLPKPIDVAATSELAETMPVYALGFPFGELLSVGKDANPAITVSRAAVSSIRTNKQGEVATVQLDNTLNPGNSGGPIVDERGRLVGVAVARIRDSNIGLAIPAAELRLLLQGRVGTYQLISKPVDGDGATVAVEVKLVDPLSKLSLIAWHYRPAADGRLTEAPNGLAALAGGHRLELKREGTKATGEFALTAAEAQGETLVQAEYVNGEGRRTFSPVKPFRAKASAAVVHAPTGAATRSARLPTLTASDIPRTIADLGSDDTRIRQAAVALLARSKPVEDRQAEVAKALEPLLKVVDEPLAAAAARALGRWATADNVPALTAALESQSVVVRWAALDAIGYFPGAKTAEATAKRLSSGPDRLKAGQALQLMGPKAEAAVMAYLSHADIGVRLEACKILKMIGTPASVAALQKAADDPDTIIAQAAEDALRAVKGR